MHDMYMHANSYLPASLSVNSLLTATATIRKKSSSPAGLYRFMLFICLFYRIVVVVASTVVVGVAVLMLLLVHGAWYCVLYLHFMPGRGFVSTTTTITLQNSFTFALTFYLPLTPAHHSHTHSVIVLQTASNTRLLTILPTPLSLLLANRSRYSYIVLWKCIAALKCNRWSPSNSRLFVLFLFVLAVVLLFMLPPLALAGGGSFSFFCSIGAVYWNVSSFLVGELEIVFFCLASLGFCTLGAKRTEYSVYCLRLGT